MMAELLIKQLDFSYGLQQVLKNINLQLEAGETLALVGPSGCGKTTLLHLCAGLLPLDGTPIHSTFQRPGCLFQQPRLLPWKTTLDNLALGLKAQGVARQKRQVAAREMAQQLELDEQVLPLYPHQLSGGMQSRVALGRLLLTQPDLLLLDEPFSALDIGLKTTLYQKLLAYRKQHRPGTLLITHDLTEALYLADRLLLIAPGPGRIVDSFTPELPVEQRTQDQLYRMLQQLLARPKVRKVFELPEEMTS